MFRTELVISPLPKLFDYSHRIITTGSCFSEVMGSRLKANKFVVSNNPFGTVFNAISIVNQLDSALFLKPIDTAKIVEREGQFLHYDYSALNWHSDSQNLLKLLQDKQNHIQNELHRADWLILTIGTAFVYEHQDLNSIVANCHKQPAKKFNKRLLSITEMAESLHSFIQNIQQHNPKLRILFTLSPVRHLKDNLVENNVSKAVCRVCLHQVIQANERCYYFPAYELIMDDLRDYRFYAEDLIHVNEMGEKYVWEKFISACVEPKALQLMLRWQKVSQKINHKAFYPGSASHQQFLNQLLQDLLNLKHDLDVSDEIDYVQSQIKNTRS